MNRYPYLKNLNRVLKRYLKEIINKIVFSFIEREDEDLQG